LIIFDASALVSAALKVDSVPERALLRAEEADVLALSAAVDVEIAAVLNRPKFARAISMARRGRVLEILRRSAVWFEPTIRVTDCRDPKDNKYLELATGDCLKSGGVWHRGIFFASVVDARGWTCGVDFEVGENRG
jgi:uncharacterized protein